MSVKGAAAGEADVPTMPSRRRSVVAVGFASGLLYVSLAATPRLIQEPPVRTGSSFLGFAVGIHVLATIALFALFAVLLSRCATNELTRNERVVAFAFPIAFNLFFISVDPGLSVDLLSYISHGYIGTALGGNPLVDPSFIVANTSLGRELASFGWRPVHPASPYGPLWTHIEEAIVGSVDGVRMQMVALKTIVVVASLGSALLIWKILGRVSPHYRLMGTLAYLWNPVVIVEVAGEGHNDPLMVFLVLLALLVTIRGRTAAGLVAMSLSVMTKYVPLVLAPPQVVYLWRARPSTKRFAQQVGVGIAAMLILGIVLFMGFWDGTETWTAVRNAAALGSTGSTRSLVSYVVSGLFPDPSATVVDVAILAVSAVLLSLAAWSVRGEDDLLRACAIVSVVYLFLASPTYWPWYVVLPVGLLALVPRGDALTLLFAISLGSRLAAPLDVVFFHQVLGPRTYYAIAWILGLGLPLLAVVILSSRGSSPFALPTDGQPDLSREADR
jgi:alpha-1,6-mannosyltransferase